MATSSRLVSVAMRSAYFNYTSMPNLTDLALKSACSLKVNFCKKCFFHAEDGIRDFCLSRGLGPLLLAGLDRRGDHPEVLAAAPVAAQLDLSSGQRAERAPVPRHARGVPPGREAVHPAGEGLPAPALRCGPRHLGNGREAR